jgi:hypothetical protein
MTRKVRSKRLSRSKPIYSRKRVSNKKIRSNLRKNTRRNTRKNNRKIGGAKTSAGPPVGVSTPHRPLSSSQDQRLVRALADRENVERAKREADLSALRQEALANKQRLRQEALANKQRLLDIRQAWTNAIYGNALSSSSRGARHAAQVK